MEIFWAQPKHPAAFCLMLFHGHLEKLTAEKWDSKAELSTGAATL